MKKSSIFSKIYVGLILAFMQLPVLVLIVFSFNASTSKAKWGGFSLRWYQELFSDTKVLDALWVTIACGLLAALIATFIGTLASIGLNNMKKRAYAVTMGVAYLPMLNAEIVTGISLFLLYVKLDMQLGFLTLLISHITFCLPYVILSVMPKIRQFDYSKYEAAMDLGATPLYAMSHIMLPDIAPGIVSGFIISLTLSMDDFIISYFTTDNGVENLSIAVSTAMKSQFGGTQQKINALSTIVYVVVLGILIVNNVRTKKSNSMHLF